MLPNSDETTATAASTLISFAPARLTVASCFFLLLVPSQPKGSQLVMESDAILKPIENVFCRGWQDV